MGAAFKFVYFLIATGKYKSFSFLIFNGGNSQTTTTIATVVGYITEFFTAALGWMGDVVDMIVENPVLFIVVFGVGLAGFAIGGVKRLTRI